MSAGLSFTVKVDGITPAIRRLEKLGRDTTPIMRSMGNTFKSITEGNFNSVGARFRPKPWPALKDPAGVPSILQKSTTMAKSFHLTVGPATAKLANPMIYAAVHQFGVTIRPKSARLLRWQGADGRWHAARQVTIPPRPFYPVEESGKLTGEAQMLIRRAGERQAMREIGAGP